MMSRLFGENLKKTNNKKHMTYLESFFKFCTLQIGKCDISGKNHMILCK